MTKLVILMLHKINVLDKLLEKLSDNGIKGATILTSKGMAQELESSDSLSFFGAIHGIMLDKDQKTNYTIMIALHENQIDVCKGIIREVVGDLNEPNSGIMFTLPIEEIEGLKF